MLTQSIAALYDTVVFYHFTTVSLDTEYTAILAVFPLDETSTLQAVTGFWWYLSNIVEFERVD